MLGTADILEDLLLLGALEGKVVIGSMNRGGLAGTVFEIDDRFTGVRRRRRSRAPGFQGGKMLLRIDPDDPAPRRRWRPARAAVDELAERGLMAMVEPFISHRVDGRVRNDLTTEAVIRSATVAAGPRRDLGATPGSSCRSSTDMDAVLAATTLPVLLLGGEVAADQDAQFARGRRRSAAPT